MRVAATGATGFIGRRLIRALQEGGDSVIAMRRPWPEVDADAVVHLAGEPVAQRWTSAAKQRIRSSRVEGTMNLVQALAKSRPAVLVCASAIGIYGSRRDEPITEASQAGDGFLAEVTRDWEAAADLALGIRVVKLRIGVVLGRDGGALAKMLPLFRAGVGGRLGSGRQWMSWIHVDDVIGLLLFALDKAAVHGAMNATAPNPVRNSEFTKELAAALHRPAVLPVPRWALNLIYGEMSSVLFASERVLPQAAEQAGFVFRFPELRGALEECVR
jgi:uncharacterized protein (TIGR01777 family)